jgi:hypothetical protein
MEGRIERLVPLSLLVLVALILLLALGATSASAATVTAGPGTTWELNDDIVVPAGTTADAVIAVNGNVEVAGTVKNLVGAIGGDVTLQPTAQVGTETGVNDTSIFVLGGTLTTETGAQVVGGKTTTASLDSLRSAANAGFWRPISSPFGLGSIIGWTGATVVLVLLALLVAGLFPRQTQAVRQEIATRFWPSLGWGALGTFIVIPVVTVALVITIVGILIAIPWLLLVVPAAFLMGYVAFGALIGGWLLSRGGSRSVNLMLGAVIGVVAIQLLRLVPYAGTIFVAVVLVVGLGAVASAVVKWRRARREQQELRPVEAVPAQDQPRAA